MIRWVRRSRRPLFRSARPKRRMRLRLHRRPLHRRRHHRRPE